jgi:cytochrome b
MLTQVITGLFATDHTATQGPLYPLVSDAASYWLTKIHLFNQEVIVALVCLHVVAVLFYLIIKRDNLILPMITGLKSCTDAVEPQTRSFTPTWIAAIIVAACAAGVYFLVRIRN